MIPNGAPQPDYDKLHYTANDTKDMQRMGQIPQLRRSFHALATFSVVCIFVSTWSVILFANNQGLVDGGLAGIFWSYIWTAVGFGLVNASLAEMASIAPTAGAMYHWVSEFSHPRYEHFSSYMTGWMATLTWQAAYASGVFISGLSIQAIVIINHSTYEPKAWKSTLFVFAAVFVTWVQNTILVRILPTLQTCTMFLNYCLFFTVTILLWVRAPHNSASDIFTKFSNGGGWSSMAVSVMIGQITAIYALIGVDTAAHVAEETPDAGMVVPHTVMWCYIINTITGLFFVITMLLSITSIEDALSDPTGFPAVWILRQALPDSKAGLNTILVIFIFYGLASNSAALLATSRQIFAFARDRGLPFSGWISHVNSRLNIPINAVNLTCAISCLLACINIGSSIAFNAIISLFLVALMATYIVSICAVLYRKYAFLKGTDLSLPSSRWLMPMRAGMAVNFLAILYSLFGFFWCFWPNSTSKDLEQVNWAPLIFGAVLIFATLMYFLGGGRKSYTSPVSKVVNRGHLRQTPSQPA